MAAFASSAFAIAAFSVSAFSFDATIPDAPTADTHDSGGYYVQTEKRKPWRKPEGDVRQWVIDAYVALSKSDEPAQKAAAVAVVAEYVKPSGEDRAVPLPRQIDWPALLADVRAVESLLRAYETLIALREEEDDDDFLLLMGY